MKKLLYLLLLLATVVHADANQDAYNAGTSFGKGNASQGTGSLSNSGNVTGAIPGYTKNPPESGYYGGVQGGDSGLADKGQSNLQGNDAAQSVISSGTTNPPPAIDPDATFITAGKNAEAGAGSILDGTNQQCTQVSVSKSTFENYQCDKDVASVEACTRTATASGHMETSSTIKTINITKWNFSYDGNRTVYFSFDAPDTGPVISATLSIHLPEKTMYYRFNWWGVSEENVQGADQSWPITNAVGTPLGEGQASPVGSLYNKNCLDGGNPGRCRDYAEKTYNWLNSGEGTLTLTLTMNAQTDPTRQ